MRITYAPKGGEPRIWDFEPAEISQPDAEEIEKRYGRLWDEFLEDLRKGGSRARRVLLWHLQRREHPTLRYEDTPVFRMGELTAEFSVDELLQIRDQVLKSHLSDEEKDGVLAGLDIEIRDQGGSVPVDEPAALEPGKALPTSD